MRLLLLTGHASRAGGGVSVAVRDLARALSSEAGVDVRVVAIADGDTHAEDEPEWQGIDVRTFPIVGPRQFGASPALLKALSAERYDVVHVHGLWRFHGLAALRIRRPDGRPAALVVSPHGMLEPWILARSRAKKAIVSALFQSRLLRRARLFHVLSDKEGDDVRRLLPTASCTTVPNIVSPPVDAGRLPDWWRPAMTGRTIFLFLGRLHEKKGCMELCDAWEALCDRDAGFRDRAALVFCGPGDGLPALEARVAALDRRFGCAVFAGPQYGEAKPASYAAADFFCLPSKSEGVPLAVLEAWAAGVPAILTPECNLPDGFAAGAALMTGTDVEAIAASLARAFHLDADERAAMARAARSLVEDRYSRAAVVPAMLALYHKAAG